MLAKVFFPAGDNTKNAQVMLTSVSYTNKVSTSLFYFVKQNHLALDHYVPPPLFSAFFGSTFYPYRLI